jgi:dTDP-4-dehydrorhamnose 3,5-epimerase
MNFQPLALAGSYLIEPEAHADERGFFARTFCEDEFLHKGLIHRFPQSSVSFNISRGTVRGMHFSATPHEETKLVRCTHGAICDVIVDLRRASKTYLQKLAVELSAQNRRALYVPAGFAHGFQVLQDATEMLYMIDTPFIPGAARGIRWNDPSLRISWPEPVAVIADRDLQFPDWIP